MPVIARYDTGNGEPGYVFSSPCCGMRELAPPWVVAAAKRQPDGRLRLQCGRSETDPLRPVPATSRHGCGEWFEEDVRDLT